MLDYGLEDPGFEPRHTLSVADAASHSMGTEALS
jgi:hypothetical protein